AEQHGSVRLLRHQEQIFSAGYVQQRAGTHFVKLAEGVDGAVEIASLLEEAAGEQEVADGAIGEVESAAGTFLLFEVSQEGSQQRAEALRLPDRKMTERRGEFFRQAGAVARNHGAEDGQCVGAGDPYRQAVIGKESKALVAALGG